MLFSTRALLGGLALFLVGGAARAQSESLSGVTFAGKPKVVFVGARKLADALGWSIQEKTETQPFLVHERAVTSPRSVKRLLDGTVLLAVDSLTFLGAEVSPGVEGNATTIKSGARSVELVRGKKRVEVDIATQKLRAFQGDFLVLETPISSGRAGHRTPTGSFVAGPLKQRMHYSSLYNEAEMPYSVQVNGNVFFHGFDSVPKYPASHGCIRIPLDRGNPARWLYEWIDRGTPIRISGTWRG